MLEQKTYLQPCYLSSDLRKRINVLYSIFPYKERKNKRLKNNLFAFFNYYNTVAITQDGIGCATYIGWRTFRRFFGNGYKLVIQLMQKAGILYTNNKYKKPKAVAISILEKSKTKTNDVAHIAQINAEIQALKDDTEYKAECRLYWLNNGLLSSDWELFHVKVKKSLQKPIKEPTDEVSKYVSNVIKKMQLPLDKAQKELQNYIQKGTHLNDKRVKYDIKKKTFKSIIVKDGDTLITLHNQTREDIEAKYDGEFIKNNKAYYYIPLADFHEIKTHNIDFSYMSAILMMSENRTFAKREVKTITRINGLEEIRKIREHHNITNLASILRKHIRIYRRKLKNLDLKNSQFMFLTHAINNTDLNNRISYFAKDFNFGSKKAQRFFKLTRNGVLYDYIARELNITRGEAKDMCFEVLFDETRNNEKSKLFKELFGEIYDFLVAFKARYGYAALSQELQYIEASIIIDEVYVKDIMPNNFLCVPIHDSFFCSVRDFDKMSKLVIARLDSILGKGNYKISVEEY